MMNMHAHTPFKWLIPSLLLSTSVCAGAQSTSVAEQAQDILAKNCYSCHGPDKQKNGLRLDTQKDALFGGDSGEPAFVAGKSDESVLFARITTSDPKERMPAGKPALSSAEIEIIKEWIDAGAPWAKVELTRSEEHSHWAFNVPIKAPIPEVSKGIEVRNPIDAFIGARLESEGLTPMPIARL
jgi:mono/diheme cytochrome c family protein